MGGKIDVTPLRMETDQHVPYVPEISNARPHLPIHHPQPSLDDGPGAQVSRSWLGLEEGLAQSPLGFLKSNLLSNHMTLIYLP